MQTLQKTYKRNFPTHNLIIDDIRNIDNNVIPKLVRGRDVDVIIGGTTMSRIFISRKYRKKLY